MVLGDHLGSIIFSACIYLGDCDDVLEYKFLAIREGFSLALQWSTLPIEVESDCLEAVSMVLKGGSNLSKYSFLIREIKHSMGGHDSCTPFIP